MNESKLSTEERNDLEDKSFGLPDERKYPLNDEEHIKLAIRFFNYCPSEKEEVLANNINKALKKFNMKVNVGDNNRFSKYVNPKYLNSAIKESYTDDVPIEYLEIQKKWLDNQLYIINKNNDHNMAKCNLSSKIYMIENDTNRHILSLFRYQEIDVERLIFTPSYSPFLTEADIMKIFGPDESIESLVYIQILFKGNINKTWLTVSDEYIMMYYKDTMFDSNYIGIIITDTFAEWVTHGSEIKPSTVETHDITTVKKNIVENNVIAEGFGINANGDIKITIGKSKSYMDEYMEAHRILVENYKNKNYEAMKTNIAFLFSLISVIERDQKYKNRDPEVVKARAFAINDFKTYLKYVQDYDSSFDFVEYYKKSDFDKIILNIPRSSIIGVKKLFKTILM